MPEIAEVQTMVNDLNQEVRGRTFLNFWTDAPKLIRHPKAKKFNQKIKGKKIKKARRRGKVIIVELSNDLLLLFHAKMTGHFLLGQNSLEEKFKDYYIHAAFYLDNNKILGWTDQRKFSRIELWSKEEKDKIDLLQNLGPEPLEVSFQDFYKIIHNNRSQIKCLLLKQDQIVGIGNIYASEILWAAKIHPEKKAIDLTRKEVKTLYKEMQRILKEAIKLRGTTTAEFRDIKDKKGQYVNKLQAYHKDGEKCSRCGELIVKKKICGRSTFFCPQCQSK